MSFQGKYAEGEREIKQALDLDPNNALAHAYYAEILVAMAKEDYALYEKAAEQSRIARDLDPNLLEAHRARGIVLLDTQNLEEAVQEFETAIALNKNIADLHLNLGVAYRGLEKYDLAQEALTTAYTLNPKDPIALIELSRAFFADGRYAQATQYAEEAVKIEPANPRRHAYLGMTYYKQEDYEKAIPSLDLALTGGETENGVAVEGIPMSEDETILQYYYFYGFSLVRTRHCAEAVALFQNMLTLVPDNEIAVYNANEAITACKEMVKTPEAEATAESTGESETPAADEVTEEPAVDATATP
jgi:tetratricopeptide (TPR) repeat protein